VFNSCVAVNKDGSGTQVIEIKWENGAKITAMRCGIDELFTIFSIDEPEAESQPEIKPQQEKRWL
jgi:hypothetical protein